MDLLKNLMAQKEDTDGTENKQKYKIFLQRYKQAQIDFSEYEDIFGIIITSEIGQNLRLKADRKCEPEQTFEKLNRSLEFLSNIDFEGVKKLDVEVNKYEHKIEVNVIKSFLQNLSNLRNINNICVNEFNSKERNPYIFLLFMSYEPQTSKQTYQFNSYSQGRKTFVSVAHNHKKIITSIQFCASEQVDGDFEYTVELKKLFSTLINICTVESGVKQFITEQNLNKNKSIEISYTPVPCSLYQQLDSVLNFLSIFNQDQRIQRVSFNTSLDRNKKSITSDQLMNLKEFANLEIFSKLKMKVQAITQLEDMTILKQMLPYIKALSYQNFNYSFAQALGCEPLLLKNNVVEGANQLSEQQAYDNKHFTTLKLLGQGQGIAEIDTQFKLIDCFPNIQKVTILSSQSINRPMLWTEHKNKIIHYLNTLRYFYFQRVIQFNRGQLSLSFQKLNFASTQFTTISDIILSVNRAFHLKIETYNTQLFSSKSDLLNDLLKDIAFKTNIVSVQACPSILKIYEDTFVILNQVKHLQLQYVLYHNLVMQQMIYNPSNIFLDLLYD